MIFTGKVILCAAVALTLSKTAKSLLQKRPSIHSMSLYESKSTGTGSASSVDETTRDSTWKMDANSIEYAENDPQSKSRYSFKSLEGLGMNVSANFSSRNIIPYHIVGGSGV